MSTLAVEINSLDYRFKNLGLHEGLPSVEILQTFQQSNGFMWFATDRGVSRYDGKKFTHFYYSPGDDFHISNNFVTAITEDVTGNIWLATEVGLNRISIEGKVTVFTEESLQKTGLTSSWIQSVFVDSKGRLWVANSEATQIYNAVTNRFKTVHLKQPSTTDKPENWQNVFILKEDVSGNIFTSDLYGLLIFNEIDTMFHRVTSKSIENSLLTSSYINAIEPLSNGIIAVGTEKNGLFINLEGSLQRAYKASYPPGDAREDWIIFKDLANMMKKPLGYNNVKHLRESINKHIQSKINNGVKKTNEVDFIDSSLICSSRIF